jgi:hypothetical protein
VAGTGPAPGFVGYRWIERLFDRLEEHLDGWRALVWGPGADGGVAAKDAATDPPPAEEETAQESAEEDVDLGPGVDPDGAN